MYILLYKYVEVLNFYQSNLIFIVMSDKLKELEIKKLIKEYDFLLIEDEYKKELIEKHKTEFLKKINDRRNELGISPKIDVPITKEELDIKKEENSIEVNQETRKKIKNLYRKIVKLTHPDKTKSEKLINTYIKSKKYYEQNNLLELYLICIELEIKIDLSDFKIEELLKSVEKKRMELQKLEKSYLWMWVKAENDVEKEKIIKSFIEQNG
jgi:tRNA U34 5-carboxymethylaminomethyl modifying GTPase MnmE/TrmE